MCFEITSINNKELIELHIYSLTSRLEDVSKLATAIKALPPKTFVMISSTQAEASHFLPDTYLHLFTPLWIWFCFSTPFKRDNLIILFD